MCTAATTGKKFAKKRWLLLIMAKQFIHKFLQTAQCGTTYFSIKKVHPYYVLKTVSTH